MVVDEAAASKIIGLSRSWMRHARLRHDGPAFIRIGRAIRYRVSDLDAWLDAHRVQTRELTPRIPR
jgi:predicted DNA-binding transcriptional regulator AlpA